jgi:hypothetical protein
MSTFIAVAAEFSPDQKRKQKQTRGQSGHHPQHERIQISHYIPTTFDSAAQQFPSNALCHRLVL